MKYLLPIASGAAVSVAVALLLHRLFSAKSESNLLERLRVANFRGVRLPASLGFCLAAVAFLLIPVKLIQSNSGRGAAVSSSSWWVLAAVGIVFLAGLADDLAGGASRGIRGHLRASFSGHLTTGVLKICAVLGSSLVVVLALPDRGVLVRGLGIIAMAGCANLWNGLDVRPGRAGKATLVVASVICLINPVGLVLYLLGAESGVFFFDLREWAMLGDAGSNVLGFVIGVGLYATLGTAGLAVCAALVVLMNLLAETVTLSRLIALFAPLRWLDELGRIPSEGDLSDE